MSSGNEVSLRVDVEISADKMQVDVVACHTGESWQFITLERTRAALKAFFAWAKEVSKGDTALMHAICETVEATIKGWNKGLRVPERI